MEVKVIEVLNVHDIIRPATEIVRAKVWLDNHTQAYVVCYRHADHVMWLQGKFFVTDTISKDFFKLHVKFADLAIEMTAEEEAEYASFRTRSYEEMEAYLHG